MPFDGILFAASIATATEAALTAVDSATVQSGRGQPYLWGIVSIGANNQYGYVTAPSMKGFHVLDEGVTQANTLVNKGIRLLNPMTKLQETELLTAYGYQDSGDAELEKFIALVAYADPMRDAQPPKSDKTTIVQRITVGTASVANTWTMVQANVLGDARGLEKGKRYKITKMSYQSATGIAFRLQGGPKWAGCEPTIPANTDVGQGNIDLAAMGLTPEFTAGDRINAWAYDTGTVQGILVIECQEV